MCLSSRFFRSQEGKSRVVPFERGEERSRKPCGSTDSSRVSEHPVWALSSGVRLRLEVAWCSVAAMAAQVSRCRLLSFSDNVLSSHCRFFVKHSDLLELSHIGQPTVVPIMFFRLVLSMRS